jgi:hypothetical protein
MKRIFLTATAASMLAFAVPTVASAHRGSRHHSAHHASAHKRHAVHARTVIFGPRDTSAPAPTSSTSPPVVAPPMSPEETAGTVASFTNGLLTITLSNGSSVSAQVTAATALECRSAPGATSRGEDEGGGDEQHGGPGPSDGQHDEAQGNEDGGHDGESSGEEHHGEAGGEDGHDGAGNDGENAQQGCSAGALAPGAVVREAELSVSSAGSIWVKVELAD